MQRKHPKDTTLNNLRQNNKEPQKYLYCIVGPSASGKTTLVRDYIKAFKSQENLVGEIVSTTTRKMRTGEVDGVDYYFVPEEACKDLSNFIEAATYCNEIYGITSDEIQQKIKENTQTFAVVSLDGAIKLKKYVKDAKMNVKAVSVFINTPSGCLVDRMIERGDSSEKIIERIDNMIKNNELENGKFCNYVFSPTEQAVNSRFMSSLEFSYLINSIR